MSAKQFVLRDGSEMTWPEIEDLIARIPVTEDGVRKLPGDYVWILHARGRQQGRAEKRPVLWSPYDGYEVGRNIEIEDLGPPILVSDSFSTRKAAEQASKEG